MIFTLYYLSVLLQSFSLTNYSVKSKLDKTVFICFITHFIKFKFTILYLNLQGSRDSQCTVKLMTNFSQEFTVNQYGIKTYIQQLALLNSSMFPHRRNGILCPYILRNNVEDINK